MAKGIPSKRYTPKFKQTVVETMIEEHLSVREAMRRFEINDHGTIERCERIYLTEEPEDLTVERVVEGVTGARGNCRTKWKRICRQGFRDFVRRMNT